MPAQTLFSADFIDIHFQPAFGQLRADWKGYQTDASVRDGCERMLALMQEHRAYEVLNDNTNLLGIWLNAAEWLATDWFPRMKRAGMKRFAWVYSPARLSQISADGTLAMLDHAEMGIRMFADTATALAWLAEQGNVQAKPVRAAHASHASVLIIEDNKDIAQVLHDMLQIMGRVPHVAGTALRGLELARSIRPGVIFCDIGLPGEMSGFDLAKAVRRDTLLATTPLVAVSGYTSDDMRAKAVTAGFDRIFSKPIRFSDIREALATFSADLQPENVAGAAIAC